MENNYFQANVTILQEVEGKNGTPKTRKVQEVYIIKADSPEKAMTVLRDEMTACPFEWSIKSLKMTKITGIIE